MASRRAREVITESLGKHAATARYLLLCSQKRLEFRFELVHTSVEGRPRHGVLGCMGGLGSHSALQLTVGRERRKTLKTVLCAFLSKHGARVDTSGGHRDWEITCGHRHAP